jgi:hypothetical protein
LDSYGWIARAKMLSVTTLILHATDNTSSPLTTARRLAQLRPDIVQLETFLADHTLAWNSDRERWTRPARRWIAESLKGA